MEPLIAAHRVVNMSLKYWILRSVGVVLLLSSPAAFSATIDLTNAGANGGGYGNTLSFSSDGVSVTATGWAETGAEAPPGSSYYLFETAEVSSWVSGIGICNRDEGLASVGCNSAQEVDTVNRDDLLVLVFDQVVDFQSLTIDPFNDSGSDPNDRDIIYWIGNAVSMPSLSGATFGTLDLLTGFGGETLSAANSSYNPYTHQLSGTGNVIVISGNYHDLYCTNSNITNDPECEAYKIANITVTPTLVPVPAAIWLMGSALAGVAAFRRRRVS